MTQLRKTQMCPFNCSKCYLVFAKLIIQSYDGGDLTVGKQKHTSLVLEECYLVRLPGTATYKDELTKHVWAV